MIGWISAFARRCGKEVCPCDSFVPIRFIRRKTDDFAAYQFRGSPECTSCTRIIVVFDPVFLDKSISVFCKQCTVCFFHIIVARRRFFVLKSAAVFVFASPPVERTTDKKQLARLLVVSVALDGKMRDEAIFPEIVEHSVIELAVVLENHLVQFAVVFHRYVLLA